MFSRAISNYILLVLFAIAMYVYMLFVMLLNNLFPSHTTRGTNYVEGKNRAQSERSRRLEH